MGKPRKTISLLKQKRLQQEASSKCPFCHEVDVSTIEFHHIDGNPSNNEESNLIFVCSSCHTRIERGTISRTEVETTKQELCRTPNLRHNSGQAAVIVEITSSNYRGNIAQTINTFPGRKSAKIAHPPGSIGANLAMKGYIDYLIGRYFDYRKADSSYGSNRPFSKAVIHKNIERQFGAKTFFLPEHIFPNLKAYLTGHIDNTIQGRRNGKRGLPNYHSFQKHCREFNL